jgi:hypothetical protein
MTDKTIHELAQLAVTTLNCSHPDTGITELQAVLERLDPNSADASAIQRAINQLEEIAGEIAQIERALSETDFTFGKLDEM